MLRLTLRMSIFLIFAMGFNLVSFAQEKPEIKTTGLSLDALFNIETTIASKTEETVPDAPSSVTVFTREEIEKMGVRTLRELLDFVPGFQSTLLTIDGPTQAVQPRGRFRTSLSPDVLFLMDGQRLNEAHTGGATAFSRLISLGNVKQVEVIRGPGSALYGSNAFLGVVNVVTLSKINQISIRGGENGMREAQVLLSKSFGDFEMGLFGLHYYDAGQKYSFSTSTGLPDTRDPREKNDLHLSLIYKRLSLRTRFQERIFNDFFNFDVIANDVNVNKTWQTSVNLQFNIVEKKNFKMSAAYHFMRNRWRALAEFIPEDPPTFPVPFQAGPYFRFFDNNLALDIDYKINDHNHLIAGAFYRNAKNDLARSISTYGNLDPINGEPFDEPKIVDATAPAEKQRNITGAYVQDKITFNFPLSAFVGSRFDHYSEGDRSYSTFNPRGGLIYKTPYSGRAKILYGSAFRAPAFAELYVNSPIARANPDLKPEEIETLEFIYIQDFAGVGRVAFTVFDNDISGAIIQTIVPSGDGTSVLQNQNKGSASYFGGELEITFAPTEDWLVKGTFTRIFDSKRIAPGVPNESATTETFEHYASLIINYQALDWNFNFNGILRSRVELLPDQGSYFIGNGNVRYRINARINLELDARNIFDEQYNTFGETNVLLHGAIPNRGRELSLGLNLKY